VAAAAVVCLTSGRTDAAPADQAVRAGDLAVQLARAAGVRLPADHPEKRAAAFLRARGIMLAPTADTPLFAGDLVDVARSLGVQVKAAASDAAVTPAQAVAFVGAMRGTLRSDIKGNGKGSGKEGDIDASCRGREARSGRDGTPASPADPNAAAPPCEGDGDGGDEPTP
jgi:hypothetical protein